MDPWELVVWGLVLVPMIGMIAVVADLVAAYDDLVLVRSWRPGASVEHEQAKHNLWSQCVRALVLTMIAMIAYAELLDILTREGTASMLYVIAFVGVIDAFRARRSRRRMIAMIREQNQRRRDIGQEIDDDGTDGTDGAG